MKNYSIVVCGTVTNKSGFRFKVLNDVPLPGTPARYLEIDAEKLNDGSTYIIRQEKIDGNNYAIMVEYRKIMPREQETSRGAYIAVGIVVSDPIPVNDSIVYYQILAELHAHLKAYRNGKEQFVSSFNLEKYMYRPKGTTMDSAYLVDTLCKASFRDKPFEKGGLISYDDIKYADKIISSKNFKYISDNSESLKMIKQLKDEIEEYRSSLVEYKTLYQDTNAQLEKQTELYNNIDIQMQEQKNDIRFKEQLIFSLERKVENIENELRNCHDRFYKKEYELNELKRERDKNIHIKPYSGNENFERVDNQRYPKKRKGNSIQSSDKDKFLYIIVTLVFLLGAILILWSFGILGDKKSHQVSKEHNIKSTKGVNKKPTKEKSDAQKIMEDRQKMIKKALEKSSVQTISSTKSKTQIKYPQADEKKLFYTTNNVFNSQENKKTSVWYVYGRILELVDQGKFPQDVQEKLEEVFSGNKYRRYAQTWAEKLHLVNGKKILLTKEREQGLLAIWECKINNYKKGHIGFIEEIEGNKYRLSDYDRKGKKGFPDKKFRDRLYTFPINEKSKSTEEGYLGSCLPTFYKLAP